MASAGASLERRLERLETAYRARRQPQITVVRHIDEEPDDELTQRDDVLVIQRVMVTPPEHPIEEPPALPEPVTPSIDRPSRPDTQPTRFSRILPDQPLGIV
jgi:hypothetical protein